MSDIAIWVHQAVGHDVTPVAPWTWTPDSLDITPGVAGWLDLRLTAGKTASDGFVPGYIPRSGALPEIDLAVDLEAGGDAEQLRTVKIALADQLSDGQIMSTWLREQGVSLAGALIQIFPSTPTGTPYPEPLWTGVVRHTPLTLTRISLECESPLDSDPLGEIVSDSSIRPIVYGQATKVKLPALPIAEDIVSPLVRSVSAPTQPWTDPPVPRIMGQSDCAGLLYATLDPVSNQAFVVLSFGLAEPDLSGWFPGLLVPDSNDWYVEVVSGKGAGQVRRLTAGSSVVVTVPGTGVGTIAHPFAGQNLDAVRASEWTRSIKLQIDYPFLDPESGEELLKGLYKRTYNSSGVPSDAWEGGAAAGEIYGFYERTNPTPPDSGDLLHDRYVPSSDRSYLRIIRKGRSFALPVNSGLASSLPIFVKNNSKYIRVYNAEDLFRIDSGILRVVPSADSMDKATCYDRLYPDWDFSRVLAEGGLEPPSLAGSLATLFGGNPGTTIYYNRFRSPQVIAGTPEEGGYYPAAWNPQNHIRIGLANSMWDLEGVDKILLCVDATFVWEGLEDEPDGVIPVISLAAMRAGLLESWWQGHWGKYPSAFGLDLSDRPGRQLYLQTSKPTISLNSIPPGSSTHPGPAYSWLLDAVQLPVSKGIDKASIYFSVFIGAYNPWRLTPTPENVTQIRLKQLMLFSARVNDLSEIYVDINGPTYGTDTATTQWNKRVAGFIGWTAVPLTSGLSTADVIADHCHAYEDIFRRHVIGPWLSDPVDGAAVEQAYVDINTKTQTSLTLAPLSARPRMADAITESSPQVGDVVAQICRDGMLVGSRTGRGKRTLKAFLARTLLPEFDAEILEAELFQGSITEAPVSPLSKLVSAPLIRYGQQGGAPARYIQVTRPDAPSWQPSYTIGFDRAADAQRAWEICHRGWLESGVAHAREIRMDSIPDYDSLMALVLQPRGTTFLDWLSRPKRRLRPQVSLSHPAVLVPRGGRIRLHHFRYAPDTGWGGAWGTLGRTTSNTQSQVTTLELYMDLAP